MAYNVFHVIYTSTHIHNHCLFVETHHPVPYAGRAFHLVASVETTTPSSPSCTQSSQTDPAMRYASYPTADPLHVPDNIPAPSFPAKARFRYGTSTEVARRVGKVHIGTIREEDFDIMDPICAAVSVPLTGGSGETDTRRGAGADLAQEAAMVGREWVDNVKAVLRESIMVSSEI